MIFMEYNIVLFGDSNTYGYNPLSDRFENRYSVVLKNSLGSKYNVFEEGKVGRTTIYNDERPGLCGIDDVLNVVSKYKNINLFVIMLGTNDIKIKNARTIYEVKNGLNTLINKVNNSDNIDEILIISPILLSKDIESLDKEYDYNSYILSKQSSIVYEEVALKHNCFFFDAKDVAIHGIDGEHMTEESHIALGNALAEYIRQIGIM
jgi:lysophospholipase L1-like esterase